MAVGRSRLKQLPDLKIKDMVAVLSDSGVVWFGQLIDFRGGNRNRSGSSNESSSARRDVDSRSSASVAEMKALIHWWDHDRSTSRRTKTYNPHWRRARTDTRKSRRRKGRQRSGALPQVAYSMRKPGSSWEPVQDWVRASSLLFWCPFGKMFTQRGTLVATQQRMIERRAQSYNLDIQF